MGCCGTPRAKVAVLIGSESSVPVAPRVAAAKEGLTVLRLGREYVVGRSIDHAAGAARKAVKRASTALCASTTLGELGAKMWSYVPAVPNISFSKEWLGAAAQRVGNGIAGAVTEVPSPLTFALAVTTLTDRLLDNNSSFCCCQALSALSKFAVGTGICTVAQLLPVGVEVAGIAAGAMVPAAAVSVSAPAVLTAIGIGATAYLTKRIANGIWDIVDCVLLTPIPV